MSGNMINVCTRCGKPRIVVKTWTEKVKLATGISVITHTQTACPDPNCQKRVDAELKSAREKKAAIEKDRVQRAVDNKAAHEKDLADRAKKAAKAAHR
jgi:uncharacterized protein YdaU (DUF1376 family)